MKIPCYTITMKNVEKQQSEFGQRLKELRRKKGLTQAELAKVSGMSRRMIVHYESYVKMPPTDKIKKIAEAIGVSSDDLIGIQKISSKNKKRTELSYKLMKKFKIIEELPTREQNTIFSLINALAEKNKLKKDKKP